MKDLQISVFKNLYKPNEIPFVIPLWKSLERIKIGKSKEVIEYALKGKDKDEYNKRKNKLPCILFAGEFKERSTKGLTQHSGLMVIDFDGIPNQKEMDRVFKTVTGNKHIVTFFISPSKKGFKGVVKIPKCSAKEHSKYFAEFQNQFDYDYFDISNSNVDRVCFESYDPNIYINYNAEVFKPTLIDKGYSVDEKVPLIPIDNEADIVEKIMKFKWKKDFKEGERNNFIFDLAGAFCEYGINQSYAEGYIYNNVVFGKFSENEMKTTIKSAYKIRQFNTKYFENYNKVNAIKVDLNKPKDVVLKKHKINEDVYNEVKEVAEIEDFWEVDEKQKIKINPLKYKLFLEGNGFKKYYPDGSEKPTFVKVESNKVESTSTSKIKDFVLNYLVEQKQMNVWNYCASYLNLFSDQFLMMLDSIDLMMLKDSIDKSYIAYENGILEITKNKFELKEYMDIDGYIWKSHILSRDFKPLDNYKNDYSQFIYNISNKEPLPIETVIGYLCHTYKNRSNNKAIILNDEIITNNPEGGTGKGLFVQGVSEIRKTHIIDGKNHNDKASFQNQSVSLDDKILVFDDIPKNFNFENQFSLITEGITIRHLYKDPIKLSVQDSPKIVLSTNYAVKGEGNSHDRRRHEVEVAQYYGGNLTPAQEFKRHLFDEWNDDDFSKFDNYIIYCIQSYFKNGLVKQNTKNLKVRKFIAETAMEFYEWCNESNIALNSRHNKIILFENFTNEYSDFKKWLTRRRFTIWVNKWASYNSYKYNDGVTNGEQWLEIIGEDKNDKKETEINFDEVPF